MSRAVLTSGDVRIRRARIDDIPSLVELRLLPQNRVLVQLDDSETAWIGMLQDIAARPWGLPMVAEREGRVTALLTTALPDLRASQAYLLVLMSDIADTQTAALLYVRHVFWSFPLQRLHAQVPQLDVTTQHVDLLASIGFVQEGTYPAHALVDGDPCDVMILGLLREDFEATARTHPELGMDGGMTS